MYEILSDIPDIPGSTLSYALSQLSTGDDSMKTIIEKKIRDFKNTEKKSANSTNQKVINASLNFKCDIIFISSHKNNAEMYDIYPYIVKDSNNLIYLRFNKNKFYGMIPKVVREINKYTDVAGNEAILQYGHYVVAKILKDEFREKKGRLTLDKLSFYVRWETYAEKDNR